GVVGTHRLRTDVLDAGCLDDSTDRAAGDHAGTRGSGLEQDSACAVLAHDLVGDGGALGGDLVHILLGSGLTLADGLGHFARLADAVADGALAVAHDHQSGKLHDAAALHGLGHAVDGDHLGDHAVVFTVSHSHNCLPPLVTA